ncbi:MAG: flagellin [Thermotoga sp.]|nr:MAG: flagellin [Thermotoga sp.]HDM70845.1 flagellin [Thermotogales bacterium]
MRIDNINAMNAWRILSIHQMRSNLLMSQLASGNRLVNASVDAAGMAISKRLAAQVRGYNQALNNIFDGIGALRTAEGAMGSITNNLQRIRELTVQASNGTLTEEERYAIQQEINQLAEEIDRTARTTEFNNQRLLTGEYTDRTFQTGPNPNQQMTVSLPDMRAEALGLNEIDVTTQEGARNALEHIDEIMERVNTERARVGAYANRLESAARNVANAMTNVTASLSGIEDMDMARGIMDLIRINIMRQSTTAILAQANLNQNNVLNLLGI